MQLYDIAIDYIIDDWKKYSSDYPPEKINDFDEKRSNFENHFPLNKWNDITLEDYSLGLGSKESVSYLLEYGTYIIGSMRGGGAEKHIVYFSQKKDNWYFPEPFPNEIEALEAIKNEVVDLGFIIQNAEWTNLENTNRLSNKYTLFNKLLFMYFPEILLPIGKREHLLHFSKTLHMNEDDLDQLSTLGINRRLTSEARKIFGADAHPHVIERFLYTSFNPLRRYWKVSPGEDAMYWNDCKNGGYICIGWDEIEDMSQQTELKEFKEYFATKRDYSTPQKIGEKASEVWRFAKEITPGDIIVANKGTSVVVGIGEASMEGYKYRDDRPKYKHTVGVDWFENIKPFEIPKKGHWGLVTVKELKPKDYDEFLHYSDKLVEYEYPDDHDPIGLPPEGTSDDGRKEAGPTSFFEFLNEEEFVYDPLLIENFLLSLKVKPFVILTGNSGTGKTKIAQLFTQYLTKKKEFDTIETDVKVGKSISSKGWTFPKESFLSKYPHIQRHEGTYDIEVDGVRGRGRLEILTRLFYDTGNEEITKRLIELQKIDPNQRIPLNIIIPARDDPNSPIVPVGANWTENRHIVGFNNVITEHYQSTRALDIILEANHHKNQHRPYFLILDEMNLSHVERYFADFLSAMESDETIPLHKSEEVEQVQGIPKDLTIPSNLFVVGTVNIDETTYMFSPKVLDRANTIEFSTHPASKYLDGESTKPTISGDVSYLEDPMSNLQLRTTGMKELRKIMKDVRVPGGDGFWKAAKEEIQSFQDVLRSAGFDFGFRVMNEVIRFLYVSWTYEKRLKTWSNWERYFDAQVKQKMLPKIHGSQRTLGDLLQELFYLCYESKGDIPPRDTSLDPDDPNVKYLSSAMKIKEMDKILHEQHYVSFTR
jgi:Cdc6-like AAA superfamily ATPase